MDQVGRAMAAQLMCETVRLIPFRVFSEYSIVLKCLHYVLCLNITEYVGRTCCVGAVATRMVIQAGRYAQHRYRQRAGG